MQYLGQLLGKLNLPERAEGFIVDLSLIESKSGMTLPADYKFFLSRYSGYEIPIGNERIKLWDGATLLSLNETYGIFGNFSQTVAIGDNGSGEWIGIEELDNARIRVILSPFAILNSKYHIEIGKSFTDFVERLSEDGEWFDDEE